jgi:hypothetical protein
MSVLGIKHLMIIKRLVCFCLLALPMGFVGLTALAKEPVEIIGQVIGMEVPDFGWSMHFQSLKVFYVRVEIVEKGKVSGKYIRIAYGHNPTSNPKSILPDQMFDARTRWRFQISKWDDFDSTVDVSRIECDWFDTKNSKKVEGSEFESVPLLKKLVPIKGFEEEAIALEKLGKIEGYWLDFENKNGYKLVKDK